MYYTPRPPAPAYPSAPTVAQERARASVSSHSYAHQDYGYPVADASASSHSYAHQGYGYPVADASEESSSESLSYQCDRCDGWLSSEESYEEHAEVPCVECPCCDRLFMTKSAMGQHCQAVHYCGKCDVWLDTNRREHEFYCHTNMPIPRAPVPSGGHWVRRCDFTGRKSFGFFHCSKPKCKNRWRSAHAQPKYSQGCKRCNTMSHPYWLWVNAFGRRRDDDSDESEEEGDPHDHDRCEACAHGDCTAIQRTRRR